MADVKDILGVGHSKGDEEKAPKEKAPKEKAPKMKRPEGMSREAFALLGGSHPLISSQFTSNKKNEVLKKPKPSTKGTVTYQYKSFTNPARTDGLELMHWVKCYKGANGVIREPEDEYAFAKYNKKVQLIKYNDEEYEALVKPHDHGPTAGGWSREETDYLFDLAEQLDLRWNVVWDRYEWPVPAAAAAAAQAAPASTGPSWAASGGPPGCRNMDDLKERYYSVARRLLAGRTGSEAGLANNPLVKTPFSKVAEVDRKKALATLLARGQQQIKEEHAILAEARAIEERRKAEAGAARKAAAAAQAAAATAAAPRTASPAQPLRTAAAPAAPGAAAAPAAPAGASSARPLSPTPSLMGAELRHPADFESLAPPGVPSLFDTEVKPYKPKPGVYLRGAHTHAMAAQQASAMAGGSRAFKAVETTLTDLGCPQALGGPRIMTRAASGAWLALRSETISMHEMRRGLANRMHADAVGDRPGGAARRPEKRRRP